jgi:L-asparaginase / beta-aspartyl-peptidase
MSYVLAIHGGAGVIQSGVDESPYHLGLQAALSAGEAVLRDGGSAVDAVLAAVVALEDFPLFNAGHGAVFTSAQTHELDASIMDGSNLQAGAVAGVAHVKNPVRAAHAVLRDGRFVLLNGVGADDFAAAAGLMPVANSYFSTPHRLAQLRTVQSSNPDQVALDHSVTVTKTMNPLPTKSSNEDQSHKFGTVGAVALDQHGHLAAATSTGGMTNKKPGRIGDTPIVGAGIYANDATCAVSATGTGEHFLRACVAHDIHARMQYGGASLQDAAQATIHDNMNALGGEGGVIAIGRDGSLCFTFNSPGMYRGWVREGEAGETRVF